MVKSVKTTDSTGDTTADDITVLRGHSGSGSGQTAAPPRILKQRFILDEKLGSGGMGTVYRAKDLRKVEAQDRQPYVAIKVLNNDFRAHPDAFIALQREASKSQGIPHPNIVSIFDFDKDGDVPYMTMELLQGQELATLLKDYPSGLPDAILWPLVEGMCAGLKRAHAGGITHSDFKPGNVFVTLDGTAKILDFGIARAVRVHHQEGDHTVFDPSKLAALTPAFASREMLQGEVPEPADDIYSLGVVIYLMLTGRHPYDRIRADEAAAQGLHPERVKRLTRRQWRTLSQALELQRSKRPKSMDEVIAGLLRSSPARPWWIVGFSAAVAITTVALWFGSDAVDRSAVARDTLIDAQLARIDALLQESDFDAGWQRRLFDETQALAALDGATSARDQAQVRILDGLLHHIESTPDFDAAYALLQYADTQAGGRFEAGHELLEKRGSGRVRELSRSPRMDRAWVAEVEAELSRFQRSFPGSTLRAELELELGEIYVTTIRRIVATGDSVLADEMIEVAEPKIFDPDAFAGFSDKLDELHRSLARTQAEAARRIGAVNAKSELAKLTRVDCQRADAAMVGRQAAELRSRYTKDAATIDSTLSGWLARCIVEIGDVDFDRATSLRQEALVVFGPIPSLADIKLDPCGVRHLVNQGAVGDGGFCTDDLGGGLTGPQLVVVSDGDHRFAIGKFEVSSAERALFCALTQQCDGDSDGSRPATGLGVEFAVAYADWLSQRSGRHYRLPTRAEWELVARAGPPDPNRNCKVRGSGVKRGRETVAVTSGVQNELGVLNLFGNVREWTTDGGVPVAMGGSYMDPISDCDIKSAHSGSNDGNTSTGLRLVREVP